MRESIQFTVRHDTPHRQGRDVARRGVPKPPALGHRDDRRRLPVMGAVRERLGGKTRKLEHAGRADRNAHVDDEAVVLDPPRDRRLAVGRRGAGRMPR